MGSMTKDDEKEDKHTKFITKNPKVKHAYYFLFIKS